MLSEQLYRTKVYDKNKVQRITQRITAHNLICSLNLSGKFRTNINDLITLFILYRSPTFTTFSGVAVRKQEKWSGKYSIFYHRFVKSDTPGLAAGYVLYSYFSQRFCENRIFDPMKTDSIIKYAEAVHR